VTKVGEMLNNVSGRLAILELACMTLNNSDTLNCVFSVKEKNFGTEDYAYELSKFLGQTLRLTMDCQIELDKLEETLQYNVQSSSEKKGA